MKILNPKYAGESDDEAVEAVASRLKSEGKLPEGVDGKGFLQSISKALKELDEQPRDITANIPLIVTVAKKLEGIFGREPNVDITNGTIDFQGLPAITMSGERLKAFLEVIDTTHRFEISPSLDNTFDFFVMVPDKSKPIKEGGN